MNKEISLSEILTITFAQMHLMKRVFFLGLVVTLLVPLMLGGNYTVTGEIVVWAKKIERGLSGEMVGGDGASYFPASLTDIETENNILRSIPLIKESIGALYRSGELTQDLGFIDAWIRTPLRRYIINPVINFFSDEAINEEEDAINALTKETLKSLEIVALPGSNVITVNYESDDPARAAIIVNKLMDSYLLKRQNLILNEGTDNFFLQKKNLYKERLHTLEQEKLALFKKYNVTQTQEELSLNLNAINVESNELSKLTDQLLESNAWLDYLKEQLLTLKNTHAIEVSFPFSFGGAGSKESTIDTEMKEQINRISSLQAEFAAARSAFKSDSSRITTLTSQLNEQKKRLIVLIENRILEKNEAVKVQQSLIENKRLRLAAYQQRNDDLKQAASLEAEILTELRAVNDAYFKYSQQYEEKRSQSIAKLDDLASVRVLSHAQIPLEPSSPKPLLLLLLGLLSSVLVAFTVGLIAEINRSHIRGTDELEKLLGVPVIAVFDDMTPASEKTPFSLKPRILWKWLIQ